MKVGIRFLFAAGLTLAQAGLACGGGDHGHEHAEEHGHGEDHGHDEGHAHEGGDDEHNHDDGHAHDDGHEAEEDEHGHGHGHGGGIAVTHFTAKTELFVEFDPLVVGQDSAFAAHLTRLGDYRAVASGTATVVLTGGGAAKESFAADISDTPGIFRPVANPKHAGQRNVSLKLEAGEISVVHDLGVRTVYAEASQVVAEPEDEEEGISFLKEAQWKMPFVVEPVQERTLNSGLKVFGRVQARPDGESVVTAPLHGRLVADENSISLGSTVAVDQRLATLAPALDTGGDLASLKLAVDRARAAKEHAKNELHRVSGLHDQGAVSERRVADAKLAHDQSAAELSAARRRVAQFKRLQRPGARKSADTVEIRAPISGTIVELHATAGAFVEDGQALFRIVNPSALRVHALVPEAELSALEMVRGAWVWPTDGSEPMHLGPGTIVSTEGPVDPESRAVEALFTLPPDAAARVGQTVDVELVYGPPTQALAVPKSAVIWDAGIPYAFVMLGGESFLRRQLELGPHAGPLIAVKSGLTLGERIVVVGADVVALAEAVPAEASHGHMH